MKNGTRLALHIAAMVFASESAVALSAEEGPPSKITFFVYYKSAKGLTVGRPDAEVSRVGAGKVEHLGTTNAAGEVTIAVSDVFKPQSVALLFCDPQMKEICAAVRLDSKFLEGFAEFNIQLPIFQLVDRVRVAPR